MESGSWVDKVKENLRSDAPISVRDTLTQAWQIFTRNLCYLLPVAFLAQIPGLLGVSIMRSAQQSGGLWLTGVNVFTIVIDVVVSTVVSVVLIKVIASDIAGTRVTIKEAFRGGRGSYIDYFGQKIALAIVTAIGIIILVLPGVYWGVLFSFAPFLVVLEGDQSENFFARSAKLVKGSFLSILYISIILMLPGIVLSFLFKLVSIQDSPQYLIHAVFSSFVSLFSTCVFVIAYFKLN